jgi:hypothetical protein
MPVSGVSGPAGPVSGAFGPASFPGPRTPPPGRPPERRSSSLPLVLSIVAVVLVVVVAGVVGVVLALNNGDDPVGANSADPTAGSGQTTPARAGGSAKYDATKLPANLCENVELGRLATQFDSQASEPTANRTLNNTVSIITCTVSRLKGTAQTMSLLFTVTVYRDPKLAGDQQKQGLDNAKLNDPNTKTLDGIGDEAYVTRTTGNENPSTVAMTLEMRAANLRWSVYLTAYKISGAGWNDQERAQFVTDLGAAVKASHTKYTGG